MWRYMLAGLVGGVAGAAVLVGAALLIPEEEATGAVSVPSSWQRIVCQDALTRRQNAEHTIANPPLTGSGRVNDVALKEAKAQLQAANTDAGRFCGG